HRSELHRRDVRRIDGLRVTSPERTLADVAAAAAAWMTEDAAESALYLGLTTGPRILERIRGRPGTAALRAYLEGRGDGRPMASQLERRFWRLMRRSGLAKRLKRQLEVVVGGRRCFVDTAIPHLLIAIELDGLEKRTSRSATNEEYRRAMLLTLN